MTGVPTARLHTCPVRRALPLFRFSHVIVFACLSQIRWDVRTSRSLDHEKRWRCGNCASLLKKKSAVCRYVNLAQQVGGIDNLLDSFFGFLRRKTDFLSGAESSDKAREAVIKAFQKNKERADEEVKEKAMKEKKRKAEEEARRHACLYSSPVSCTPRSAVWTPTQEENRIPEGESSEA